MGRQQTVTGAPEADEAMAAPAAGIKRAFEATGGDEKPDKKRERYHDVKEMLKANLLGSNASPRSSNASTRASCSSSFAQSPVSILESQPVDPLFGDEIASAQDDLDRAWLDDQMEELQS